MMRLTMIYTPCCSLIGFLKFHLLVARHQRLHAAPADEIGDSAVAEDDAVTGGLAGIAHELHRRPRILGALGEQLLGHFDLLAVNHSCAGGIGEEFARALIDDEAAATGRELGDAGQGADGGLGEHIADDRVDVGAPRLMPRAGKADENRRPPRGIRAERLSTEREQRQAGEEEHRHHATFIRIHPAAVHHEGGNLAEINRHERDNGVKRKDERHAHARRARVVELLREITGRPEKEEPPHAVGKKPTEHERPGLAERERLDIADLRALRGFIDLDLFGVCLVAADIGELRRIHQRIGLGLFVEPHPKTHPHEAQRADDDERHLPAPELRDKRNRKRSRQRADGRARVEYRCRERAVLLGEVLCRHLDRGGKVASLADGEHAAAGEEEPYRRGHSHHADETDRVEGRRSDSASRMQAGAERPDEYRPEVTLARAEPVDELAGEEIAQRVDDREYARDRAVVVVGPAEYGRDKVLVGERKDLAVEVVDRGREKQQRTDNPAEVCLFHRLEPKVVFRVVVGYVLDDFSQPLHIGGNFAALDLFAEFGAENAAEIFVPGVAQERARVGEHADEITEAAQRRQRLKLLFHAVLLIEEPPCRAELDLALVGTFLEAAHERGEHFIVAGIERIENGARQRVRLLETVEQFREPDGAGGIVDRVETGIGAEAFEHARVQIADAVVVKLRGPAGLGVHLKALEKQIGIEPFFGDVDKSVIGKNTPMLLEILVALGQMLHRIFLLGDGLLENAVGAPRRQHLDAERLLRDGLMKSQVIIGIVGGADYFDIGFLHQPARRKILLGELRVALLPDLFGVGGAETVIHSEVARKLQMAPVEKRIFQQHFHRLGELDELVVP